MSKNPVLKFLRPPKLRAGAWTFIWLFVGALSALPAGAEPLPNCLSSDDAAQGTELRYDISAELLPDDMRDPPSLLLTQLGALSVRDAQGALLSAEIPASQAVDMLRRLGATLWDLQNAPSPSAPQTPSQALPQAGTRPLTTLHMADTKLSQFTVITPTCTLSLRVNGLALQAATQRSNRPLQSLREIEIELLTWIENLRE